MRLVFWTTGITDENKNYIIEDYHALCDDKRFTEKSKELILENVTKEITKELDKLCKQK